jgi:CheY-like chemotaxis protein
MLVPMPLPNAVEPTVLVVEDEVLIRLMICDELRDAGLRVVEAANADEALAYLRAEGGADLMFTDIHMPGSMDGIELARQAQADFPALRVILTSGHVQPHEVTSGLPLIPKPYSVAEVVLEILAGVGNPKRSEPGA